MQGLEKLSFLVTALLGNTQDISPTISCYKGTLWSSYGNKTNNDLGLFHIGRN